MNYDDAIAAASPRRENGETIIFDTGHLFPAAILWAVFGTIAGFVDYACFWLPHASASPLVWVPFVAGFGLIPLGCLFLAWRALRNGLRFWLAGLKFTYGKRN